MPKLQNPEDATRSITARVAPAIDDELKSLTARMSAQAFGVNITKSRVIEMALERGLPQLKRELAKREK